MPSSSDSDSRTGLLELVFLARPRKAEALDDAAQAALTSKRINAVSSHHWNPYWHQRRPLRLLYRAWLTCVCQMKLEKRNLLEQALKEADVQDGLRSNHITTAAKTLHRFRETPPVAQETGGTVPPTQPLPSVRARWQGCGCAVSCRSDSGISSAPRNGIRYQFQVVGVNQQGIPTFGGGTGEPREMRTRIISILSSDILLATKFMPFPQRCYHPQNASRAVETGQGLTCHWARH